MSPAPTRDDCVTLDDEDPLRSYRDEFAIDDQALIYFDGNSLGRLPRETVERVNHVLTREWGTRLIRSWQESWLDLPTRIGDLIGTGLLGAEPGETVISDNTTVSLYKATAAALDARPDRSAVVIERDAFPTDRYIVESLASQRALDIRWIDGVGPAGLTPGEVSAVLDESVAVALLSHVDYRSAAILDMAGVTAQVHEVGAIAIWDLCHSVGSVPIDLRGCRVDLAVGCSYKYLNGGPGAPAFTFVNRTAASDLRQPIWGWWGRRDMFDMGPGYQPQGDVRSWLTGTPGVLSLAAVEPAIELVVRAGIDRIRQKSIALTDLGVRLYDAWLADLGMGLASPRDPARRGSHLTITHPAAARLVDQLTESGVIPDFRRPDGLRIGLSPLTTRFTDVYDGFATIGSLARSDGRGKERVR